MNPLLTLHDLARRAREAATLDELSFLLVNSTHNLVPYRQAVLVRREDKVRTLSGVVKPELNAPYVDWLESLMRQHLAESTELRALTPADVSPTLASDWGEWWPEHALALPTGEPGSWLLLAREMAFSDDEQALLGEWLSAWNHAWKSQLAMRPNTMGRRLRRWLTRPRQRNTPWFKRKTVWALVLATVLPWVPVRMTVLAGAELVPASPHVVRSPIEGVLSRFHVQPNQTVREGDPLFEFDEALLHSRVRVAEESLNAAREQYRQTNQLALEDPKYRSELALLAGAIEERASEYTFLRQQFERTRVAAPATGMALFDDPTSWIGKPVAVGERIMRIAPPGELEVEVWLPLDDAVVLKPGHEVTLYLQSEPLNPVRASLRYVSFEAQSRPDGQFAYRLRATPTTPTQHRVGLKGTAKISGEWTILGYWLLRKPWAIARATLGV
jgi:multidrug resistance efflux pump